ncbi:MAG: hypothetical protein JSW55_01285 [Chloroflexota bacterium]|nr:MAG: hypothetical protein JSW55_01285 [Chloroflexota bacterium]
MAGLPWQRCELGPSLQVFGPGIEFMCGIVCFYGRSGGVTRVLDALELLAYRAPDSSGIAIIGADGRFALRRVVGTGEELREKLAVQPLPKILPGDMQVVMGHGRWAMVGAVNETNAHPLSDRAQDRIACENGSHNATLMLGVFADQKQWWQARGLPSGETVHRSENTTEVITFEWERMAYMLAEGRFPPESEAFLERLDQQGIIDSEERALRLAIWRLREGNAHACAFYSRRRPAVLFVTSHRKPIVIATRQFDDGSRTLMVASDVNAALMLWSKDAVNEAARRIDDLRRAAKEDRLPADRAQDDILAILNSFTVEALFLDNELHHGEELFARIEEKGPAGQSVPAVLVSRYDGTPVPVSAQTMQLNPAMVGKQGHDSYTESHIAEIPDIMDGIVDHYIRGGQPALESAWENGRLLGPGLNENVLVEHYGPCLEDLSRLLLIGEGSSWRDAQVAAPLFRQLLPGILVNVYRPVEVLNLGQAIDQAADLAIEISWSGTTDSLLKVDNWLGETGVVRLAITGRPQSDLGRRTTQSGGTLDVQTGVEVSVATVKGFQAILMTLNLLALQLASMVESGVDAASQAWLIDELTHTVPRHVRALIEDDERRIRLRKLAQQYHLFNKVVLIGNSPVDIEAELKIEELAQIVARTSDFHAASLRPLIERSSLVDDDRRRILFIINATSTEAQREANYVVSYLRELGVRCLIHTTPNDQVKTWQEYPNAEVFVSPNVTEAFQALIDAPFFFDLAVAMAYARGLSPEQIDRPRNLAKSVTVTGAERREMVEARRSFKNPSLAEFAESHQANEAWDQARRGPSPASLRSTVALRAAMAVISEPLPDKLAALDTDHLIILTDAEATETGARMAAAAWLDLLAIDLTVYQRFIDELPQTRPDTASLRIIRAGGILAIRDSHTIALPSDLSPFQLELLAAVYLIGLGIRLARQRGSDTAMWEAGLAQIPLLLARLLADKQVEQEIGDVLRPFVAAGYDKVQIIGGGQDYAAAASIGRSLRGRGFMAEALYTDSAWHGPLATVGGPDADHDTLIVVLATDPLFQATALVDTQVYRTRKAKILLLVPEGNQDLPAVQGVGAEAVWAVPAVPRPFLPMANAAAGSIVAEQMAELWEEKEHG